MFTALYSYCPTSYLSCFSSHSPKPRHSPFAHVNDLEELAQTLQKDYTLDQWVQWKKEIKDFIQEHSEDLDQVDQFFKTMTEWGIAHNPQKTLVNLGELISLELLTQVIQSRKENSEICFEDAFKWASEQALFCPPEPAYSLKRNIDSKGKKFRPLILYFVPNLINILLGVFNFLDSSKKYLTDWQQYLRFEIAIKILIIPYYLVKILQPIFGVSAKVYFVAALIIVATGILISCYQRWLKPVPSEIVNCTNLDKQMEAGCIEPKVGQSKDLQRLIAALEGGANVLLIGRSGEGKTALLQQFIQLKHTDKLSGKLKNLNIFGVDCGLMISSASFGHSELFDQTKRQAKGYEKQILFIFDELGQMMNNPAALQCFKQYFLEESPRSKIIATMTCEEFDRLKKLDVDGSIRRRFLPLIVTSSSDEHNRLILQELISRTANLPVTEEAIKKILELSNKKKYLPGIGRPAKVIKIWNDTREKCEEAYRPSSTSIELSEAQQKFQLLQLQARHEIRAESQTLKELRAIQKVIKKLEQELVIHKKQAHKIKQLIEGQQKYKKDYYRLTHLFAQSVTKNSTDKGSGKKRGGFKSYFSQERMSPHDQVTYLWYYFYAFDAFKNILQAEIDTVRAHLPVQIDEDLVNSTYRESEKIEKNIYDDRAEAEEEEDDTTDLQIEEDNEA